MKFYPYRTKRGRGDALAKPKGRGGWSFEVVLIQEIEVLAIQKGERKRFPPFERGRGTKSVTVLRGEAHKVSYLRFSHYAALPPCN